MKLGRGPPPSELYRSLLKACSQRNCLIHAKQIQALLAKHDVQLDGSFGEHLVLTLVKCGYIDAALDAFYQLPCRTVFSWTAVISGLVDKGRSRDALTMYVYMGEEGVQPDRYTFVSLLKACGSVADRENGQNLHAKAQNTGLAGDVYIGTTLISMYGKCGSIMEAESVFCELLLRNVVTWNAMLSAYVEQGQVDRALRLYQQMNKDGMIANSQTLLVMLQACSILADKDDFKMDKGNKEIALEIGQALHAIAKRKTFILDAYVGNTLVSLYGKCNRVIEGENVFTCFSHRDVVSWTALISMYVEQDQGEKALQSYRQMQEEIVSPNQQTVVSALQACCIFAEEEEASVLERRIMSLEIGRALHADVRKQFDVMDAFVSTTLLGMYAKCGAMVEAEKVFISLSSHTIVQWNGMISAYVEQGRGDRALQSYRQLREEGTCANQGTYVIALQACNIFLEEEEGRNVADVQCVKTRVHEIVQALHADARKAGFGLDIVVGTTLVSMYGKCGSVAEAEMVFFGISEHNTIAWNAMLSAYIDQVQGEKALHLYKCFRHIYAANYVTFICCLQACVESGHMDICWDLHFLIICGNYDAGEFLASTLIDAYGSCGSMADAHAVFNALTKPSIAAWNSCIAGNAGVGNGPATLQRFGEMLLTCNDPTGSTFTSLLFNCSHSGLVEKGIQIFESIRMIFGMTPDVKHYVSMIDLLGRSGNLIMAEKSLGKIPALCNLSLWLSLLGACRVHSNVTFGKLAFDYAVSLQPTEAAPYVLMSNVYGHNDMAADGVWSQVCDRKQEFLFLHQLS